MAAADPTGIRCEACSRLFPIWAWWKKQGVKLRGGRVLGGRDEGTDGEKCVSIGSEFMDLSWKESGCMNPN